MSNTPTFILLTDLSGDPIIIATSEIAIVDAEDSNKIPKLTHQELDPDCKCDDCIGHPDWKDWWCKSRITLQIVDISEEHSENCGHLPKRQDRCIRESVEEIAHLLGASWYTK
jgi:hypothetical protein